MFLTLLDVEKQGSHRSPEIEQKPPQNGPKDIVRPSVSFKSLNMDKVMRTSKITYMIPRIRIGISLKLHFANFYLFTGFAEDQLWPKALSIHHSNVYDVRECVGKVSLVKGGGKELGHLHIASPTGCHHL